jgi:hypothetical protein
MKDQEPRRDTNRLPRMDKAAERKAKQPPKEADERLDDELTDTFPASDPPSMTDPHKHLGKVRPPEQKAVRTKNEQGH